MKFFLPRGMRDIESEEYENIQIIKNAFFESAKVFNFMIMEPSPLELLSTLESKSGPAIVNEIYNFTDKGNREIALRFDLTIGLTRFFVSRRDLKIPAKIASFGGVWRYDEPQSGRYRFFHQWDIEIYGPNSIESDTEIIAFTSIFLQKLGLKNIIIDINSRKLIEEFIKKNVKILDEDKLNEIFRAIDKIPKKGKNRVLKEYEDKIEYNDLEKIIEFVEKKGSYEELNKIMQDLGLSAWVELTKINKSLISKGIRNIRINLGIVRGLDYYSGIVFEAIDLESNVGSLVGGGRYNKLTETFGRKDAGATGAAGGVERIILSMKNQGVLKQHYLQPKLAVIIYNSIEIIDVVEKISTYLRKNNISVDYDLLGRSYLKQVSQIENEKVNYIIFLKKEELETNKTILLKNVLHNNEKKINIAEGFDEIVKEIKKK